MLTFSHVGTTVIVAILPTALIVGLLWLGSEYKRNQEIKSKPRTAASETLSADASATK